MLPNVAASYQAVQIRTDDPGEALIALYDGLFRFLNVARYGLRNGQRGRAGEAQRNLWDTVKAGQALALKKIKAGVDGVTIHKAIQELFADRGFPTEVRKGRRVGFFHGTGHGLKSSVLP